MTKEEKILLIDVVLQDVRGDWSRNLVERVDYVRNLCREIGGKFNILAKDCDKFLDNDYTEWTQMKNAIKDNLSRYVYAQTKRKPIILPIIMNV